MNETKQFIEILLEKSKNFEDGIFIPNEFEMKISDIENFNPMIALNLSEKEESILTETNILNNEIYKKSDFKVKLLKYSFSDDSISFYPVALKQYLKKI